MAQAFAIPMSATATRVRGVALVTLVTVGLGYMQADYAPLIPLLERDLVIDAVGAGLLASALMAPYVVVTLVTTGLSDRFGAKSVALSGLLIGSAGAATFALAPAYPVAIVGKLAEGVASAIAFIAGARYIAGLYAGRRSHVALGIYGAGYPLGGGVALALMPRIADTFGGWRPAFWAEAALIALFAALWSAAPAVAPVARRASMRDALHCVNCWLVALQHAGFGVTLVAGAWITVFLLREFDLPLVSAGTLGSLLLLVAMATRPFGGWLIASRRVQTRPAMAASNALLVLGVVALAFPDRPLPVALLGAVFVGAGGGLPYAAVLNTAAASLRDAPAAAQGMPIMLAALLVLVATPVMGFAVLTFGFAAAWAICGGIGLVALIGAALMRGEEELPAGA
jgi:MFS family permease